ncbi:MAG: nucleotide exchange factor GrpE [Candidatus Accumulibacter sp.]|uniref:nucleotide exchange factor GrpE n=1 Tax=Accumulibacter sp. TaxID=2053492 RepID=UPI001D7AC7F4|nr:nucleotide exchange factor GrpE [Accumulibacter sp.]MCB1941406.1 nucleotide exchange factor GrpE [Accumulibacter sp.]MCP5249930.1 nucleotide exchange factor GrpE [Accumulibacter sp.]
MQAQDKPADEANTAPDPVAEVAAEIADTIAAAESAPVADSAPTLEEALRAAELKAVEHHDAWLRAKAETENVRRRAQEDIAKAAKFATERFARDLLAVKDSLELALASDTLTVDSLRSGTEVTLKQLTAAFERAALTEINPLGEKFDPHRHQAISVIESPQEPNTVVTVLQKGYLLADRVLRPAMVVVAKATA